MSYNRLYELLWTMSINLEGKALLDTDYANNSNNQDKHASKINIFLEQLILQGGRIGFKIVARNSKSLGVLEIKNWC